MCCPRPRAIPPAFLPYPSFLLRKLRLVFESSKATSSNRPCWWPDSFPCAHRLPTCAAHCANTGCISGVSHPDSPRKWRLEPPLIDKKIRSSASFPGPLGAPSVSAGPLGPAPRTAHGPPLRMSRHTVAVTHEHTPPGLASGSSWQGPCSLRTEPLGAEAPKVCTKRMTERMNDDHPEQHEGQSDRNACE